MKKEKFLISTIILIMGGAITKVLGMVIRIITTRIIGTDGISLYMLIFPTFSLFMTLSQLGFPIAISKLVAEEKHNNKNVVFSIIPFSMLLNLFLMLVILIIAPILSNHLLKDERTYYPILAIALVLPFDSLSSILRGYFFGKQKMFPHVCSNIFEQIIRLILIIILIPKIMSKSLVYAVVGLVSVNIISELSSIFMLMFFLPKKISIKAKDIKPSSSNVKDVLRIALPTTGGRIIGSIGYFIEPIILITASKLANCSSSLIIKEYGIVEGYVMPLLLMPGFFTMAISSALIPVISKAYVNGNIRYVKSKLKQAIIISVLIGGISTMVLFINPTFFLKLIYNTEEGAFYIRLIAPIFLLYYIQSPLASILQSIDKAKYIMTDNTIAIIIRSIIMLLGCVFMGIYGFLLGMCINILIVTFLHYKHVKYSLN